MDITGLDAALSTVSAYDIGSSTSPVTLQEDIGVAMLRKIFRYDTDIRCRHGSDDGKFRHTIS